MTQRYVRDGQVAVLYSPGHGAGWSTWAREQAQDLIFDPWIVDILISDLVPEQKLERIQAHCNLCYPELYLGGLNDLEVAWIPQGTQFRIVEYDGNESIEIRDDIEWYTA